MNRVYLTPTEREANALAASATLDAVQTAMKAGTYVGADYGSKSTRIGPVFVDTVNGTVVPTSNPPVRCLTRVTLRGVPMAFACRTSSVGPVVPFSSATHGTTAEHAVSRIFASNLLRLA